MEKDNNYIQDLFRKAMSFYDQKKEIDFTIVERKSKGFLVKVSGLYGYVPYNLMPWRYPSLSCWQYLNNTIQGNIFKGFISQLDNDPIKIIINAKEQTFTIPDLQKDHKYKGIVIQKATYGLFIELGAHFNWEYGSLVGLLHKSAFNEPSSFTNTKEGQELAVTFQGYNNAGKMVLGEIWEKAKWVTTEMEKFVGTQQEVTVMIINDKKTFYVAGMHRARAPITKLWYPNDKEKARAYSNNLQDGQTILCEVIKISKKKDCFIIKLPVPS